LKHIRKTSFIIIITVMAIYIAIILYSDLEEFSRNILKIKYEYLPAILLFVLIGIIAKVFRQRILLTELNIHVSWKDNFLIFFYGLSLQATPGGLGSMIKSQFIKENYGHSLLKTMPIVLVERFHDLFSVITILVVLSFFYPIFEVQLVLVVLIPLLGFVYFAVRHKRILEFVVGRILKFRFFKKILANLFESQDTLQTLSTNKITLSCWGISVIGLVFEAFSIYFSFRAFGLEFEIIQTTLISYTSLVIGAISFLPAGIGLTEASLIGFLLLFEVELSTASALTIFVRLTTIWFATLVGFIGARFLLFRNNKTSNPF